jgi:hypothetical protein
MDFWRFRKKIQNGGDMVDGAGRWCRFSWFLAINPVACGGFDNIQHGEFLIFICFTNSLVKEKIRLSVRENVENVFKILT